VPLLGGGGWLYARGRGRGLVRFCISVRGIRVGSRNSRAREAFLRDLEPRSKISYVVDDTRVR
jgi:hypothetical protein